VCLVEPAQRRGEPGQVVDGSGIDGCCGVLQPVAGEHGLRTHADVGREEPLQGPHAHAAEGGHLVDPEERAVLDHRAHEAQQVQVGAGRLGGEGSQCRVEDGGARVVVVLLEDGGQQVARGQAQLLSEWNDAVAGRQHSGEGGEPTRPELHRAHPPGTGEVDGEAPRHDSVQEDRRQPDPETRLGA